MIPEFAKKAVKILETDANVVAIAAGGSWISGQIDQYSDLDLIIITREKISASKTIMTGYAQKLGILLSSFTGEHVGEPRLLICLYDQPLLHVDLKFITLDEFKDRIEDPVLLLDKQGAAAEVIRQTTPKPVRPDFQWMEDRFWTWIHYALLKTGRGEYLETVDFLAFLRMYVLGPLLQMKNHTQIRGVRKVELELPTDDILALKQTIPAYHKTSILNALRNAVSLYRNLRNTLYGDTILLHLAAENAVMHFFEEIAGE